MPLLGGMPLEPMEVADAYPERNANDAGRQSSQQTRISQNPSLDLEQYANSYSGLARIYRLLYIVECCPLLRMDALNMVIQYVQEKTYNVQIYQQAYHKLAEELALKPGALGAISIPVPPQGAGNSHLNLNGPDITHELPQGGAQPVPSAPGITAFDQQWVEQTSKRASLKLEKLDTDLKHYKSNSIKESIRRGQDDLGEHYLEMGDLHNALKCFSRSRDYCTSSKHVVSMCFNVIKVSVYLQNWALVLSYVSRAENAPDPAAQKDGAAPTGAGTRLHMMNKLKAAAGLAELANCKYKNAAKHFLQVNFDNLDYPEVISANNLAQYGALCALASFDREELQKTVIGNAGFKQFLELEPWLNEVIRKFNDSEYADCLGRLLAERDNLLLDMFLAPHLDKLYAQIRHRGLTQYFSPYLSADMRRMAAAFNTRVNALENELMELILDGRIKARIDSRNKVLHAKDVDQRTSAYDGALTLGALVRARANALLLRAAAQKAGVNVRAAPRDVAPPSLAASVGFAGAAATSSDVTVTPSNSGQSSPVP